MWQNVETKDLSLPHFKSTIDRVVEGEIPVEERIQTGIRKANSAAALIRLEEFESARRAFRDVSDPETISEFHTRAKKLNITANQLWKLVNDSADPYEIYTCLLALENMIGRNLMLARRNSIRKFWNGTSKINTPPSTVRPGGWQGLG